MGGNLLQKWGLPAKRVLKADYEILAAKVIAEIKKDYPERRIEIPKSFSAKESHGDIDFLVSIKPGENFNWANYFSSRFDKHKAHKNGSVYSVPIEGVQCDFLIQSEESYEHSLKYTSYESGMPMGIMAMYVGARHKMNGFYLKLPLSLFDSSLPSHDFREICVTRNIEESFALLGMDYARFQEGFDNFEEYCEWFVKGKFFNRERWLKLDPDAPLVESEEKPELNHKNRIRNKKRPNWANLLTYIKDSANLPNNEIPTKEAFRAQIELAYPHVTKRIEEIRAEIQLNQVRRSKFNGNLVVELTGLQKEDLGNFIKSFRAVHQKFEDFLDSSSKEDIVAAIQKHHARTQTYQP